MRGNKMTKGGIGCFFAILLLTFAVRIYFRQLSGILLPDESLYIRMGQNLVWGTGLYSGPLDLSNRQPLLSLLFSWVLAFWKDPVQSCQITSAVIGTLTLIPFHFCCRQFGSDREALWSDGIYALAPFCIQSAITALPHAIYLLWLSLLFLCLVEAVRSKKMFWMVLAGASGAAAYWTRVEGLVLVFFLTGGWLVFALFTRSSEHRQVFFRGALVFFLTAILLSFPLILYLRILAGEWQLVYTGEKGAMEYLLQLWGFSPGTGEMNASSGANRIFLSGLQAGGFTYLKNFIRLYTVILPRLLPVMIWFFVICGICRNVFKNESGRQRLGLALPFILFPVLFYPLIYTEPHYLYFSLFFLIMFSGSGIQWGCEKIEEMVPRSKKAVAVILGAVLAVHFVPDWYGMAAVFREDAFEQKQMGEWIRDHYARPQVILGSDKRICFYAGNACRQMVRMTKTGTREQLADLIRQAGIDLIAADDRYLSKYYPSYGFLLGPDMPVGLEPVKELTVDGHKIILYQIKK